MSKKNKKTKKVLKSSLKTIRYLAGGSLIALFTSLCAGSIAFLKINHYKNDIQTFFTQQTGLNLDYAKLQTGFTIKGEPFIKLNNIVISDAYNNKFINIKYLYLTLSYSSLWHLTPVFNNFEIYNSDLTFELDKQNNLLLNNHLLFNLATPSNNQFNFGKWFVLQDNIKIKNIDLTLLDTKHDILPLIIDDIQLSFNHNGSYNNNLQINAKLKHSNIDGKLNFDGDSILDYKGWDNGILNVHNLGNKGYIVNTTAEIRDGEIQYIKSHLDSNKNLFTSYSSSYGNVENFYGSLLLERIDQHKFKLDASHLTLSTEYGYLFHNADIKGEINTEDGGSLNINNLSLNGINSIIKYFAKEQRLEFSGDINAVNLKWYGDIKSPRNISLNTSFSNIALKSDAKNIPSFDHLSGSINTQKDHGRILLSLNNSSITAPELRNPITISQLITGIDWQLESQNKIKLSWDNSLIKTPDTTITTYGEYNQRESNLKANLNIQKLNLANVYKYLPTKVDKSVVKDLKENFSGYLVNTTINIDGNPAKIPFSDGSGKLTINGTINNARYLYLNGWPSMQNVNGKINGTNQKISFTSTAGKIGELNVNSGTMSIADITSKNPQLIAKGEIFSNTQDYISFIANTPLHNYADAPASKVNVDGSGTAKVNLDVPLNNPEHFKLNGTYKLYDNKISLKENESYNITALNGTLNFTQKGISTGALTGNSYNSELQIKIPDMHNIEVSAPDLNYTQIINQVNPKLTEIIHGTAATNIKYNIDDEQLSISSGLESVVINAPHPLYKAESTTEPLFVNVNLKDYSNFVNVNYKNILYSNIQFNQNWEIESAQVSLGSYNMEAESDISEPKVIIKSYLDNTYINEWIPFAHKMSEAFAGQSEESTPSLQEEIESEPVKQSFFPVLINWNSNAFRYDNYNFGDGNLKLYVYPNFIQGKITGPNIDGRLAFIPNENHADISLDRLILSSYNLEHKKESHQEITATTESTSYIYPSGTVESFIESKLSQESAIPSIESTNLLTIESINSSESEYPNNSEVSKIAVPSINFYIKNLYLENYYWGSLRGSIIEQHDDLFLNDVILKNKSAISRINIITHCISCTKPEDKYVAFNIHSNVYDFGSLLTKANQGDMFTKGNGTIDISAMWPGGIADFNLNDLEAYANLSINDGVIVKVKPGIFGALMGVINLGAININHFNFNSFFGQSFAFNTMQTNLYLKNSDLHVDQLELSGDVADISTFGNYYVESKTLDTYLTVQPKIAGTIATTAGIVTLNPIIGGFIYLAQKLIGDPINKALAISYHVTGDANDPKLTQTKISKQIIQNFKSSMNLFNSDDNDDN